MIIIVVGYEVVLAMEFCICLAGHLIAIRPTYNRIREMCDGYIVDAKVGEKPSLIIEISHTDIEKEKKIIKNSVRTMFDNSASNMEDYLEIFAIQRKIACSFLDYGILLLHGSVIETGGKGYMFTAPSGVGKTTRTILWKKMFPDSIIVNGDKPWIKIDNESVIAYGSPWCGKEKYGKNTSTRLNTIFFLERAEEDCLTELAFPEAFLLILRQTFYQDNIVSIRKTLSLLKCLEGKVRFFRYCGRPTMESIKLAYETAVSD